MQYGPSNFLWFSDIALLLTGVALWMESRLLVSMTTLSVLIPDTVWNLDFLSRLLLNTHLIGGTEYMFEGTIPLQIRNLSYFHVFLPGLLLVLVARFGYDRRALPRQVLLAWCVYLVCYLVATPETNINWVFGIGKPQQSLPPLVFLAGLMILIPCVIYLPTHLLLHRCFDLERRLQAAGPTT